MRGRLTLLTVALLAVWTALLANLAYIQLGRRAHYESEARRQHWTKLDLLAQRGRVLDRMGRPLVLSRSCASVRILPQYARDKDTLADILARYGLAERDDIRRELQGRDRLFWLRRHIEVGVAESLRSELVRRRFSNCVYVDDDATRVYPFGASCASVIGFMGAERGLAGIEAEYDSILHGRDGWVLLQRDALGRAHPYPRYPMTRPVPGADIQLTLDLDVQEVCLRALAEQIRETGALKASAVVIEARTGAVLGMADYPSFDPNCLPMSVSERQKCTAVSDQFEPGSSFKLVICAAALESPNAEQLAARRYDVSSGFVQIGKYAIRDVHPNGVLDFAGLFAKSSNPGCALLSMEVSPDLYYRIARGLGFGSAIGLGMPNEGSGFIDPPSRLGTLRFANIAFGQGVTVTLAQLAAAYLCVANDGLYLRPYLIESVQQDGRVLRGHPAAVGRRVLSPGCARAIKDILEKVVTEGTGALAQIDGVPTCGKTGTAQKTEPGGGYSRTRSRMTFVGFFPKVKPIFVVAVLIDEPTSVRFAGATACPAFKSIGDRLVRLDRMRAKREADVGDGA